MNKHIDGIITFEKANQKHEEIIFEWLSEPHMMEFWDNTQEHKDDILNFIRGLKQYYFYGTTKYWIGSIDNHPYAFILTDEIKSVEKDLPSLMRENLSKTGTTITLDFGIGNKAFLGKGLATPTLKAFIKFYQSQVDHRADTYFIDPDVNNPRAIHVYQQAGFKIIGKEAPATKGGFIGQRSFLMVQTLPAFGK